MVTNAKYDLDFRAMVEPSMPLEYAKMHFAPALQTVIK
jgi:salicylate hydroxylase